MFAGKALDSDCHAKPKGQYLLTLQVSRYCLLALRGTIWPSWGKWRSLRVQTSYVAISLSFVWRVVHFLLPAGGVAESTPLSRGDESEFNAILHSASHSSDAIYNDMARKSQFHPSSAQITSNRSSTEPPVMWMHVALCNSRYSSREFNPRLVQVFRELVCFSTLGVPAWDVVVSMLCPRAMRLIHPQVLHFTQA